MTSARQQVLVLHLTDGDLGSTTVAWAFYDGTLSADDVQMQAGSENEPPYSSVLDAMLCETVGACFRPARYRSEVPLLEQDN